MKNKKIFFTLIVISVVTINAFGWGFWAHKKINHAAVNALPIQMRTFYKNNWDFITEHATTADRRKYVDSLEGVRHYIDIDHYGTYPYNNLPRKWEDAVAKYTEDTLKKYGWLPWNINQTYYRLVDAMKAKDIDKILYLSADLGHYIGDATVPLHTTLNYDGQFTGMKGLHALWESKIPEMFGDNYNLNVAPAKYIDNVQNLAWKLILESNTELDSVINLERQVSKTMPANKKYDIVQKGDKQFKYYSDTFATEYAKALNHMEERKMRVAIYALSSLWMSAWVDAGQPDLEKLAKEDTKADERNKAAIEESQKDADAAKNHGKKVQN